MRPLRPVLRYHGGKWRLAPWIISFFPKHRCYVEPFGGGASVLMRKEPSYAEVYNDMDEEVVGVFRVLRDPTQSAELLRRLELTPFARTEFLEAYRPNEGDPVDVARCMIVRSLMGFGADGTHRQTLTGFRANSNRSGTTPARDWRTYPSQLPSFVERLRGVVIENRPAGEVIAHHDSATTLIYADPPYPHSTRSAKANKNSASGRAHGYRHEMSNTQHRELAGVLRTAKGMVVLSGYACDLYAELFGDWKRVDRKTFADGARARTESLWLSPNTVAALHQTELPWTTEVPA